MEVSKCCDALRWIETDICSACKEHADFVEEEGEEDEICSAATTKND